MGTRLTGEGLHGGDGTWSCICCFCCSCCTFICSCFCWSPAWSFKILEGVLAGLVLPPLRLDGEQLLDSAFCGSRNVNGMKTL